MTNRGVRVSETGSFFAGGRQVTLSDQPRREVQVARNAPARVVDLNGDYITGQCYVQFVRLVEPQFDEPVMFWHGGAMTGVTWETTPDGRPGWQHFFLQHGFDTYVCDAMERGRAGWSPYPQIYPEAPIFRTINDAWSLFRLGDADGYASDAASRRPYTPLQFPIDSLDDFAAQFVPRWTGHAGPSLDAYLAALSKTGPVWLIAHSQGANLALEVAARHPQYFKGLIAIEPASAPGDIGSAARVPHLFVWGDHIDWSPIWPDYRAAADEYRTKLLDAGADVSTLDLPAEGVAGNSHVPMMDLNSDWIAQQVLDWIGRI